MDPITNPTENPENQSERIAPTPPPIRPREPMEPKLPTSELKLEDFRVRSMDSDIKAVEAKEVLPPEGQKVEIKPETILKIPEAAGEPKKKTWLYLVGGLVIAVGMGAIGYFLVFPKVFPPKTTAPTTTEPTAGQKPIAAVSHKSYFTLSPAATVSVNLTDVSLLNITTVLQKEATSKLADGAIKEVVMLDAQDNQVAFGDFMSQIIPELDRAQLDQKFENDFTAFLYYDSRGVWPGYIAKMKVAAQFKPEEVLEGANLSAFYLTTPGVFTNFKDGQADGQLTRYAVGSQPGAAFNYGIFGDYFPISTSYDGLKAALPLLGI